MGEYWNHNTAFHPELVQAAAARRGRVLDVGCGDGLLLSRLRPVIDEVVGVDTDAASLALARARLGPDVRLHEGDFRTAELGEFDTVFCVAALHHVPLQEGLLALRRFVAPGGRLHVIGLAANAEPLDWLVALGTTVPARLMGRIHGESEYDGMVISAPKESLREIRDVAGELLPGARLRRRFYYRYSLIWTHP